MASTNTAPSSWEVSDVEARARRVDTLGGNEVDGPTLVTFQHQKLPSRLEILSLLLFRFLYFVVVTIFIPFIIICFSFLHLYLLLPARSHLWDLIESILSQLQVSDSSVAIDVHEIEIETLSTAESPERGIVSESEMEDEADALKLLPTISHCNVCYIERISGFSLACDHAYCIDCMKSLFKIALKDTSLLPLRCCAIPIDMNVSSMLLEKEEMGVLELRLGEIQATSKMHCTTCSHFINLDLVDSSESTQLLCVCGTLLCTSCKTGYHSELSCIENKAATTGSDDLLFGISRTEGWKQCPGCEIMIELEHGCNHMTCANCIHEFCFKCLRPWQGDLCSSGRCEVWDEGRLIAAGEIRYQAHEAAQREVRAALDRRAQHRRAQRAIAAGEARLQAHEVAQREAIATLGRRAQLAIADGEARMKITKLLREKRWPH
jgi:hypothetical protein